VVSGAFSTALENPGEPVSNRLSDKVGELSKCCIPIAISIMFLSGRTNLIVLRA